MARDVGRSERLQGPPLRGPDHLLQGVRWSGKYAVSSRQLAEMMAERGGQVEARTIGRWVRRYAPLLEQAIRWCRGDTGGSWRVDATGVRVSGERQWLFRAVDTAGRTIIDVLLSHRRNATAAKCFLAKALRARRDRPPHAVNTDKHPASGEALRDMKRSGAPPPEFEHRRANFLTNRLEADHRSIKRLCRAALGFEGVKTAYATLKGFEAMRMIRKQQCVRLEPGVAGEVRFVAKLFRIPA